MDSGELKAVLSGASIDLCYQPMVRLHDRQPIALEALARLNHPVRGMLQPREFVPHIEDAGMAAMLTDLVVGRAFAEIGPIQRALQPGITLDVSVNMPLDVLLVPDALDRFDRARDQAGIPAERVIVELTESRPVADLKGLRTALDQFRAAGYRAAIDDLTPEMAHNEALLDLPFSMLKFDYALIDAAMQEGDARDFLLRTIRSARLRGLSVVAEGVEDEAIWDKLAGWSVDAAQGFWIARPLLPGDVADWCAGWLASPPSPR